MGVLIVSIGSGATALYIIAAVYLIFLNPKMSFKTLLSEVIRLHKQLPILLLIPVFVITLFLFSVTRSNFNDLIGTLASHVQLLLITPMAIGITAISKIENSTDLFVKGLRTGILIILPVSIIQLVVLNLRPEGGSGNALVFAFVLALAGALSLMQDKDASKSPLWIVYGAAACAFFMVLISFSRAPIVISFIFLIFFVFYFAKKAINLKHYILGVLFSATLLLVSLFYISNTSLGKSYLEKRILAPIEDIINGEVKDSSFKIRLDLQITGFYAFIENPLTGYGLPNTVEAANAVSETVLARKTDYEFSHLHNDYLTYAVAGGAFTFLQFLLIIFSPILISRKVISKPASAHMLWFSLFISISFASIALTNVVLGHDIMSTFFSMCFVLILIDFIKRSKGFGLNK